MNIKLIGAACNSYEDLPQKDKLRLLFFKQIWEAQAQSIEAYDDDYQVPDSDVLKECIANSKPVFEAHPVCIVQDNLADDAQKIAQIMSEQATLKDSAKKLLNSLDWKEELASLDMGLAGSKPEAFVVAFAQTLVDKGEDALDSAIAMDILSLALRCQLDKPAAKASKALKELRVFEDPKPMLCPCCGSEPSISHVGAKTSSQGRGRALVCSQCGADWEFDRIKCAHCGEQNSTKLHYYNVEGDDAHRIATCDSCKGYMRTLFSQKGDLRPVAYEVEDVVMANLDAIAADGRFEEAVAQASAASNDAKSAERTEQGAEA